MPEKIIYCGILKKEIEYLMQGKDVELHGIDPGLHVDPEKLGDALVKSLNAIASCNTPVIIGSQCHPEMEDLAAKHGGRVTRAKNCIEMLLGDKLAELDAEGKNFYLTAGWLDNWRNIFIEGLKWDPVDARQNFGFFDRSLLLDTGLIPIDEEKIIEFFDYTHVPIECIQVDLENLRQTVKELLAEG